MTNNSTTTTQTIEELSKGTYLIKDSFEGDPEWLKNLRSSAWDLFLKLPIETDPNMLKFLQPGRIEKIPFKYPIKNTTTTSIKPIENNKSQKMTKIILTKKELSIVFDEKDKSLKNIQILPFSEALNEKTLNLEKMIPEAYSFKQIDKLALLTLATFTWGSYIDIKPNSTFSNPLLFLFPGTSEIDDQGVASLHYINIGENTQATILFESRSKEPEISFQNIVINVGAGSNVKIMGIQNQNMESQSISSHLMHIHRNATVNYISANIGSKYTRIRNEFRLRGSGAEIREIEILRGQDSQFFDVFSAIQHEADHTQGQTFARGVLSDKATAIFKGLVYVPEKIPKCNSYLALHGLLMDKTARFHTIPAMEISNSDIKAAHAATVSQIDNEKIFYFQSRGIPKKIARKLISEGYVQPAIQQFPDKQLQGSMLDIIQKYWYGINDTKSGTQSDWDILNFKKNKF